MPTNLTFSDLRLIQLAVENVGPFRNGVEILRFDGVLAPSEDNGVPRERSPCNLFMLLARNGHGKTTLLECIFDLMSLMGAPSVADGRRQRIGVPVGLGPDARAQLDMRVTWTIDSRTQTVLLSIWFGAPEPIVTWTNEEIEDVAQASTWAQLGFVPVMGDSQAEIARETNELGRLLHAHVQASLGRPPTALYGLSTDLPCVLFFPANRAIFAPRDDARAVVRPRDWGYRPALRFEADGPEWPTSVDNLLVWLEWLSDDRLPGLLEYLNRHVFADGGKTIRPPQRESLMTLVSTEVGEHPLTKLSHGERALLQFFARTLCHMTQNTVILIDEIDIHLHTKWMNRLFQAIKTLVREIPSLSVVFTTHNRELIRIFDHKVLEPGLVEGGFLIEEGLL